MTEDEMRWLDDITDSIDMSLSRLRVTLPQKLYQRYLNFQLAGSLIFIWPCWVLVEACRIFIAEHGLSSGIQAQQLQCGALVAPHEA